MKAESRFSVLNGWQDVGHCIGEQEHDCVDCDEIIDGGLGLLRETTDAATEKRQESPFVGSKRLQQYRKEAHVVLV